MSKIKDILVKITGDQTKVDKKFWLQNGDLPVISQDSTDNISSYVNRKDFLPITDLPLVIFGDHTCMFKYVDFEFVRGADGTQLLKPNEHYNCKFFYYLLQNIKKDIPESNKYQRHYKYLKEIELEKFNFSIQDQQKIASILSTLDAKIELNNKINTELETMAKTLYDYWFVQFDFPDENAKPYKSSGGEMIWSKELKRDIPKGWEMKELGEVCEIYQPQTISEKEMLDNGEYYVFGANGVVGKYDQYNHVNSEIVITCRGNTCGNITRTYPYSWITGNAMVVKSKSQDVHNEFLFWLLHNINIHKTITGSAQPQITRTNLSPVKMLLPEQSLLEKFSEQIKSNVQKKLQIVQENQKLAELRDFLLPMLMNGQIVVE